MRKKLRIAIIACVVIVLGAAVVFAASTPGSDTDPVVTKSYVDNAVSSLRTELSSKISSSSSSSGSSGTFTVVQVEAGKNLIGGAGTQIILRTGYATAISVTVNGVVNGVSDLTGGVDLLDGQQVNTNHLLLVPRDDGRGIKARTALYVMVCGKYTIQ